MNELLVDPVTKNLAHEKGSLQSIEEKFRKAAVVPGTQVCCLTQGFYSTVPSGPGTRLLEVGSFPGLSGKGCCAWRPWKAC